MAEVGDAQDFVAQLDEMTMQQDALYSIIKKSDIVGSLAASTTGKYSDFWNLDKLVDLNNLVDAASNAPQALKDIFAGSKNPRLRANKVGSLILSHTLELKTSGFPGDSASRAVQPAVGSPARPGTAPAQMTSPPRAASSGDLRRFMFATDMPEDAVLNVRACPDMDSEVVGHVRAENDIFCQRQEGDWLCVDLPGSGINGETWLLQRANDRTLLMPVEESPLRPQRSASTRTAQGPTVSTSMPAFASSDRQAMSMADLDPMSSSTGQANLYQQHHSREASLAASLNARKSTLASSLLGAPGFQPDSSTSFAQPPTVSYAAYQALEMRVNRLEQDWATMMQKLAGVL
eukprot:m.156652 g.156652  ORF g.156652 m.156652 type:complete len:347 (-) comp16443_c0_seq6:3655-4695(-)